MVGLAYGLLSIFVLFGGLAGVVLAFQDPRHGRGRLSGMPDLRTSARCCYVVIAILSFVINMGDLPKSRRDADLLWIVPIGIVMDGLLWPFALARRVAPKGWWSSGEGEY
jgi:hypothetical protein